MNTELLQEVLDLIKNTLETVTPYVIKQGQVWAMSEMAQALAWVLIGIVCAVVARKAYKKHGEVERRDRERYEIITAVSTLISIGVGLSTAMFFKWELLFTLIYNPEFLSVLYVLDKLP